LPILSERLRALRRVAVICIIVSLSITALIGIATLLGGDFGEVQGKIMMTTLVIGTFSVLALADLAVAGRRFEWSGYIGILAAFVGLVMGLYLVWSASEPGAVFWKTFGITAVVAGSLAHANLLLLLGERRRPVVRTSLWITVGLIAVLAGMIIALVITDGDISGDAYFRVMGTVAILDVLGTIVVPVVSRFLRDEGASGAPSGGLTIVLPPELGARLSALAAERAMPADAFVVKILEDLAGSRRG
jgi:hypothetical protein